MAVASKARSRDLKISLRKGFLCVLILLSFSIGYAQQQISTCNGVPFSFVQPGALSGTTYTWSAPVYSSGVVSGGTPGPTPQASMQQTLVLTSNTTSIETATYQVTPSTGATFTLEVSVVPQPTLSSSMVQTAICSGTPYNYNASSATPGTSISWSRQLLPGINNPAATGQANVNEILNNITTSSIDVGYIFSLNASGCRNDDTVIVRINPTPFLSSTLDPAGICSGATFNYQPNSIFSGTTYNWQRTGNISGGNPTGTGNPNEQLVNNSLNTQVAVYTYTLTNNSTSCTGTDVVRVPVYPVATISAQAISACSGAEFMVSPTNAPFGTMYTWSNPTIAPGGAVSGAAGESVDQYYVHQNLLNTGSSTAQLVYTVTPNTFGCRGASFTVTVDLATNASPATLGSSLTPQSICSGTIFSYQPNTSAANTGISWQRFYTIGIASSAQSGNGDVSEPLVNTTTLPIPVHYAFTINQTNGCKSTQDVVVIVNPGTVLSSGFFPTPICSNTTFSYAPTSSTPGTSFNWTRAAKAGISNPAASGTDNPNETLINTTNNTIPVTYSYSLTTANGCFNLLPQPVTVQVKPMPRLSSTLNPPAICSGTTFNYPYQSPTAGTVSFNWSRPIVPALSNGANAGSNDPAEVLVNTSIASISVPYTYHLTANGCTNDEIVTVVVNPVPQIGSQGITVCSNNSFTINPSNVPSGTLYSWTTPTISPSGAVTGWTSQLTPTGNISQTLRNQTAAVASVAYSVVPLSGSCSGGAFSFTANINPVPFLANQVLPAICSGTAFSLSATTVPAGTTYTWSAPVQTPFNSLVGASAQPVNQPDVSQTLSSSNNITDTAVYYVTPSANNCVGAEFQLTVYVKPVPVVNSTIDTICTGSAFLLAPSSVPVNTTYTWTLPSATPFGSVVGWSAQPTQVPTISQVLTNTTTSPAQVVYTITPQSAGCTGSPFNATIIVGNALAPFANTTATICSGTAFDVTPATAPTNTNYTWNVPSVLPAGTVAGASAMNIPQTSISQTLTSFNNIVDTVVYTIQPYKTGCKGNVFTATVRVLPSPRAVITGKPVICRYPFDTLSVSFTGTGPWTFTYNDGGTARTVSGITSSPYTWVVPVTTPAVPSRTLAITSIKDFACTSIDSSYFTQKINPLPVGQIVSLHGTYICHGIPDTLFVSYNPAVDTLQFQWTRNGGNLPGAITDSISTVTGGRYNSLLTNQYGCVDTAAVAAVLIAVPKPQLNFSVDATCINMVLHFTNLTDTNYTGPISWTWDMGNNTFNNAYHSTATYNKAGSRHVRLTAVQQYCPAYPTSIDSTLDIQFPIPAVRRPSVSAYSGQTTPLTGRDIPGYKYQWVPSRGIDFPTVASPNFNYQMTQDYIINLISPAGCVTPDSMLVRVFDPNLVNIMVPKSFTPNGDGTNDILYPYLAGIKTFNYFKVFNRFGQLMFQTTDPDKGWNGSMNGTPQPMAIYIWVAVGIANDGTPVEKRGETLLLR